MKYIVNMIANDGKSKMTIIEAADIKLAEEKIKKKYIGYEVVRISNDIHSLNYYSTMKKESAP